eukprot:534765_1
MRCWLLRHYQSLGTQPIRLRRYLSSIDSLIRHGERELRDQELARRKHPGHYAHRSLPHGGTKIGVGDDPGWDELSIADRRKLGIQPPPRWLVTLEDRYREAMENIFSEENASRRSKVILPGFPVMLFALRISVDARTLKVFWCLGDGSTGRAMSQRLKNMLANIGPGECSKAEDTIISEIQSRLEASSGYLRSRIALLVPSKRVPNLKIFHFSEIDRTTRAAFMENNIEDIGTQQ